MTRDDDLNALVDVVDGYFSENGNKREAQACLRVLSSLGVDTSGSACQYIREVAN
jgi:hypothetical protein